LVGDGLVVPALTPHGQRHGDAGGDHGGYEQRDRRAAAG
jgi:hypothetical protein